MSGKRKVIFIILFFGFIGIMGFATLDNHQTWSEDEVRSLKQFPQLNYRKLMDVDYLNEVSDAFSDQLSLRSSFVRAYFQLQYQLFHRTYLGDTVIGEEAYLFTEPEVIYSRKEHRAELDACISVLNQEAERMMALGSRFVYVNYPRKDVVLEEYLPDYYISGREQYLEDVRYIREHLHPDILFLDVYELFEEHKSDQYEYYYKTDHHVNLRGGQLVYEELMKLINKDGDCEVWSLSDYDIESRRINGSYNRRVGQIVDAGEEELILKPRKEFSYVRYESGKKSKAPLYADKNAYSTYMDGDMAETRVVNKSCKNEHKVLFSGSSYTNLLETLMIPSVSEMMSLDFRSNETGKTLYDYAEEYRPDYVIFIPNQSDANFSSYSFHQHLGL